PRHDQLLRHGRTDECEESEKGKAELVPLLHTFLGRVGAATSTAPREGPSPGVHSVHNSGISRGCYRSVPESQCQWRCGRRRWTSHSTAAPVEAMRRRQRPALPKRNSPEKERLQVLPCGREKPDLGRPRRLVHPRP